MTILRGISGAFYEIPDEEAESFLIPDDQVKAKLEEADLPVPAEQPQGDPGACAPSGPAGACGPVVVQIHSAQPPQVQYAGPPQQQQQMPPTGTGGSVQPYGHGFNWTDLLWCNHAPWQNWNNWCNHHWQDFHRPHHWGHGGHGGHW